MDQWSVSVQRMIDWIEEHIEEDPTLPALSKHVGYSPCYCSSLFHKVSGMTLKSYLVGRRLCHAAVALRDTTDKIIDIALQYGFSFAGSSDEGFCESLWMYTIRLSDGSETDQTLHQEGCPYTGQNIIRRC